MSRENILNWRVLDMNLPWTFFSTEALEEAIQSIELEAMALEELIHELQSTLKERMANSPVSAVCSGDCGECETGCAVYIEQHKPHKEKAIKQKVKAKVKQHKPHKEKAIKQKVKAKVTQEPWIDFTHKDRGNSASE